MAGEVKGDVAALAVDDDDEMASLKFGISKAFGTDGANVGEEDAAELVPPLAAGGAGW